MIVQPGSTDVTVPAYFVDDVGGTAPGEPTTGLLFSDIETGGSASYQRQGGARVDFTLQTLANASAAHADGGFILIDDTEMGGVYRLDLPDAACATGVAFVIIYLRAAAAKNTILRPLRIDLTSIATQEQVNAIGSGATGGTHVEATYDNTTRDTIDNAGADLKGGGLVGIPVTGHTFVAGREITIAGSVAYNGAFDIVSQTANEIVITHAQTAEAFTGAETIVSSIKGEIFVGTITSGTFADTAAENGVLHSMDDDGNDINIVYGFNVGGSRQATVIAIFANVNGNTDEIIVKAYNFTTTAFEAKGTISGSGGTAFIELDRELVSRNTGTGSEIGDVFILFDTVTTTPSSLDVDKCLITAVGTNVLIGYPNGFEIAAAGTSGTEFGVNGTAGNACPFADAVTMNAANPLNMFSIQPGETVTLTGSTEGIAMKGVGWTLVLADNSISGSSFDGAHVSGIGTGALEFLFNHCHFGDVTLDPCDSQNSVLEGTFTIGTAGDFKFEGCKSGVAGVTTPVLDWGAGLGASNVTMQDYAGGIDIRNMGAGAGSYNMSLGGDGQLIVNANCSATSTIAIRGHFPISGDSTAIAAITFSDDARFTRSRITGGAYALDTDANGRIRVVDGTGAGEIALLNGTVDVGLWLGTAPATPNVAGVPLVDMEKILGTQLTEGTGGSKLADNFTFMYDIAPGQVRFTVASFDQTGDSFSRIGANGNGLTDVTLANSAIGALTFTEDAINARALATDAVDEIVDAVWDETLTGSNHNNATTAGRRLRQLASLVIANDTAEVSNSPAINQIQLASGESAVDGTFDPSIVGLIGGTGSGQCRMVLEYEGSTKLCTLNRDWKVAPDVTTEYIMLCSEGGLHVNEGLAQGGGPSTVTLNSLASSENDLYVGQFVFLVSGPGQDQVGRVTAYNGTSKVATIETVMDGWAIEPTSATGYIMMPILDTVPTLLGTPTDTDLATDLVNLQTVVDANLALNGSILTDTGSTIPGLIDSVQTDTTAILEDTGTTLPAEHAALPTAIENADALLIRDVSNVEDSAGTHSITTIVLATLEIEYISNIARIFKTDGTTTYLDKDLTSDEDAIPITKIS